MSEENKCVGLDCEMCDNTKCPNEKKEIIIDGCNVAECRWKCKNDDCAMYYADLNTDNNVLEFGFNCEDNPDCYFKQLQQAKVEIYQLHNDLKECGLKREQYRQVLKEIKEIAQGMHDWWINKTPYTDVYELAEHLLGTELNRILGVLEDSEDVEND